MKILAEDWGYNIANPHVKYSLLPKYGITGCNIPVSQKRKLQMTGWGDEIAQYEIVQAMLKLNPAQIMSLYDYAVTRFHVETYVSNVIGDDWFWNNGQTFLDTWNLVLVARGLDPYALREDIMQGWSGVATNERDEVVSIINRDTICPT